ncbi:MAG: sulfurtransferase TusA family protein [Colwellia sp.]|nr:sulfurtransferase TusA family protein [Colwellia sp.]
MIYEYDASAEKCPVPLVQLRLLLKNMSKDDCCLLKISDPGSLTDIPKLLTKKGYGYKKNWLNNTVLELLITRNSLDSNSSII